MLDKSGKVLYVGKARNLKKRVSSYAKPRGHSLRIMRMIAKTTSMMFLSTDTETEALLLEQNLIKQLKPLYNVLLRDDKSFPNIMIAKDHPFAQITKHRGKKTPERRVLRPLCLCQRGEYNPASFGKDFSFAHLHRPCFRESNPPVFATSNREMLCPMCWQNQPSRL